MDYRNGIRIRECDEKLFYTNDLHEALLKKQAKVWRSKFESNKHTIKHVDGVSDLDVIAENMVFLWATRRRHPLPWRSAQKIQGHAKSQPQNMRLETG